MFEFGGSLLRKLTTLAERSGFMINGQGEALMPVINTMFNAYCLATREGFQRKDFNSAETTGRAAIVVRGPCPRWADESPTALIAGMAGSARGSFPQGAADQLSTSRHTPVFRKAPARHEVLRRRS